MTDASGPQKIVVGIDGSASSVDAFRWAVRQAQLTGSAVEAVMAWQYPGALIPGGAADFEAGSRQALDGAIQRAFSGAPPVQVTRCVEAGEAHLPPVQRPRDA